MESVSIAWLPLGERNCNDYALCAIILHPDPLSSLPDSFPNRRLNDNDIAVLEATGTFKKLPNLRKMYSHVPSSPFKRSELSLVGGGQ